MPADLNGGGRGHGSDFGDGVLAKAADFSGMFGKNGVAADLREDGGHGATLRKGGIVKSDEFVEIRSATRAWSTPAAAVARAETRLG